MTGEERLWLTRAWILGACLIAAITVVNVLTIQHDAPRLGVIRPAIWEVSSALVTMVIFGIPAAMALWMVRKQPRWWQAVPAHLVAVFAYSVLHVSSFVALRKIGHAVLLHEGYDFGPLSTEFPYEFRKDMVAYGLATIIYWLALQRSAQGPQRAHTPALPATFDIQDGARLIRVPIADIVAVRSAGNYVEFVLADERRPLMRSSLSAVLDGLSPHGFVRCHKSWLVNSARVTGLKPEGSGDYAVELGALEVPLSRRYPEALAALKS
ncbi:LytTR family DNA-binding domain-containing protein [Caulobacter sp. FWC2]|uniref:LytTR family DNA-binding domain-containing protein n=1 Tax=Caulobacter sp. FWC2 TaxID=69664 RepID=UPI001E622912|nr:LytTR family DNA-binding domain-containing protein [Caulobacter sp. FWC2]